MIPVTAFILLMAAAVIQIYYLIRGGTRNDPYSRYLLLAAAVLLFVTIIIRSVQIRFAAITNTYESLVFYSGVICLVLYFYTIQKQAKPLQGILFGGSITAIVLLAVASSPGVPAVLRPPIPALQSGWLVLHVSFSFIGEAFFAVAFVSSIYYLSVRDSEKKKISDLLTYRAVGIGYPIFTAGALVFGAIWAKYAWGSYWSWDPKETWALITWLVYTAYLHSRFLKKLQGRASAILSIIGFAFTVFTFFGVNYLLSGLHSYR